jgi:hypothetical protein
MASHPLAYIPCEHYYSQKQYKEFNANTKIYQIFQVYEAGLVSFVAAQQRNNLGLWILCTCNSVIKASM